MMADAQATQDGRRHLNQGFGRSLSSAFEIALVPALFGLLGLAIDHLLGTGFIVATGLGLVGLVGIFLRLYYGYRFEMERHERVGPWNRTSQRAAE